MSNKFLTKSNENSPAEITLAFAKTGTNYKITNCSLSSELALRFAELGLTTGAIVRVVKKAPLGDPLEVNVRGYSLCLRGKEAERFTVKETDVD